MEILNIIIISLLLLLLISSIFFNDKIKDYLYKNSIENFNIGIGSEPLGLKWIYVGDIEPDGDKINNEKLYILLNYKYVTPVIISQNELASLGISRLSHDSYINIDGRFFKPYDSNKVEALDIDIGMKWRNLGKKTENYVEDLYIEIRSDAIKTAIENKIKENAFETIDGEDLIVFTRYELANIKGNLKLTYDSYIKVTGAEEYLYQPYYEVRTKKVNNDVAGLNLNEVLSQGFDNAFLRSSHIQTNNTRGGGGSSGSGSGSRSGNITEYYSTDIYDNKGVSNIEVSFSNQIANYRQSNDDMRNSIIDPIDDRYLPYTDNSYEDATNKSNNKINEYVIINVYKNLLYRQPNPEELIKNLREFYENNSDEERLKFKIYNSTEYKMIVKMQSNDIEPGLITNISEKRLVDSLKPVYKEQFNKEPPYKLLIPLKQCYIHLQYNDYLFKAMIMHDNFGNFEKAILREYIMDDQQLLDIFNKHFVLYELRLIANELKRRELLKRKALSTPIALHTEASKLATEAAAAKGTTMDNMNSEKYIDDIMKNDNQTININITLDEKGVTQGSTSSTNSTNSTNSCDKLHSYINPDNEGRGGSTRDSCVRGDDSGSKKFNRIYNPITYKQHYKGLPEYRPNVCSYGTKQIVNPVFLNSTTLFQGTELKEAIENTQVGSIMPKFEYREYEDVPI